MEKGKAGTWFLQTKEAHTSFTFDVNLQLASSKHNKNYGKALSHQEENLKLYIALYLPKNIVIKKKKILQILYSITIRFLKKTRRRKLSLSEIRKKIFRTKPDIKLLYSKFESVC